MAYPSVPPSLPPTKQGRVLTIIGAVIVAIGLVGGVAVAVNGALDVGRTVRSYQRVSAVTGGTIDIDDPGTYRVFYERSGADEGIGAPGTVRVVGPDGQFIAVTSDFSSETYSISGRDGRKIGRFRADTAGTYELRLILGDGESGTGVIPGTLAVGRTGPTGSILAILGGVFGGLFVVAIGVVLIIVGGVRRGRAKRAAFGVGAPGSGPMPGWAAPPTYPAAYPQTWSSPGAQSGPMAPMGTVHRSGWAPPPSVPPGPPPPASSGWAAPTPPPLPTEPPPLPQNRSNQ